MATSLFSTKENIKRLIAAAIFIIIGIIINSYVPSTEVAWVIGILLLTIYLFSFEVVPVDVAAVSIMVLLGITGLFGSDLGLSKPLVDPMNLFDGFAGNAVMSIVAVMIIGAGLDKTGLMSSVASFILRVGGTTEKRIIPIISGTVGVISSFMQNVGAAALFLPVVSRISARTGLPLSRLLMPMGFCAICGGTITMVGSSPLILLNDLIITSNQALPAEQQMQTWSLFSVTPLGIVMIFAGIAYFVLAGKFVLPSNVSMGQEATSTAEYIENTYGVKYQLYELPVRSGSSLVGANTLAVEREYKVRLIAMYEGSEEPIWANRETNINENTRLAVIATRKAIARLSEAAESEASTELDAFTDLLAATRAGIAEIVIPPSSSLIGKSAVDLWFRKTYGMAILAIHRGGETIREGEGVRDLPFQAGDTLVGHITWDALARLEKDHTNFVVVTTEYPHEELRPHKLTAALIFFLVALGLILFTDLRLSISLLAGAIGMVLSGVLTMDEAYEAVSWKTVFLLASLIPLGAAVENSGTAAWIAEQTLQLFGENPTIWLVQLSLAVLATFFTLVMSNVGATVLLVPLAVNIAVGAGANPAVFALTVAIATSNSFLIPTHQVNALIMGPGGYRVTDYMKAGGIMTILFLIVTMVMMNILF
ncbi:SLC13 family permease [Kaarinaea lacus]